MMTAPERVVLVHYHLRGGGVTRVLEHQQRALDAAEIKSAILVGEPPDDALPHKNVFVVPELSYASAPPDKSATDIAQSCIDAVKEVLGGPPDLWHIHNHCLGKNVATPLLVRHLAERGERLMLQAHDFAEDGRPSNYGLLLQHLDRDNANLGDTLYPVGANVHYATINARDQRFLGEAGFDSSQTHLLSNAVHFDRTDLEGAPPATLPCDRLFLYPTRAIRRKNIGEYLLWSAIAETGDLFGVTLAPKNPKEQPSYAAWVDFAEKAKLPVSFEMARKHDFLGLMKQADALLTTSVAEGFGLAFLEPLLIGKSLGGRKLPEITSEFSEAGIDLTALYERLDVPLAWIGYESFRYRIARRLGNAFRHYGRAMKKNDIDVACNAAISGEMIDFGRLDAGLQRSVILRVQRENAGALLSPKTLSESITPESVVRRCSEIVKDVYSLERYGQRLLGAYDALLNAGNGALTGGNAEALLDCFLDPSRFYLLRS